MTEAEAYNRLSALCASAEHCRQEVEEKMRRWEVDKATALRVTDRLVKEGFIDEVRYCRAFIHDKYRFARWGRMKIGQALAMKHIAASVYVPLMDEIDEEEYLEGLRQLLQAKERTIKGRNAYERRGKLLRFALGRGFEMEEIGRCCPDFGENDGEE